MKLAFWPGLGGGALSLAERGGWNTTIEAMALDGTRREGQDVLAPFDTDGFGPALGDPIGEWLGSEVAA
jgi:hypothetical protein